MSENVPVEDKPAQETTAPRVALRKKRDIFRFNGPIDMSLCLDHIYKIIRNGKRITFYPPVPVMSDPEMKVGDYVDFEDEEAAKRAYDQILNVWASDVVE